MLNCNLNHDKFTKCFDSLFKFWNNIAKHVQDPTIIKYIKILDIDYVKLLDIQSNDFMTETKKLVKCFFQYPTIFNEIFKYLRTNISKLDFLNKFSAEQIKYITYKESNDTKLLACAGSGKTRSIIGRIKFLVEHNFVDKNKIVAITFSKHASMDFQRKVTELFPDFIKFCQLKNFSTIDSLAKLILCKVRSHKSQNVEILSIALRNYLQEVTENDIKILRQIKDIKHLFIDEAQDLNEVQYDIIMLLKKHLGTYIHLVGDPNQNIYQFRRSSSVYLINFPSVKFELTLNFRSTQQIINFAEDIKPIQTTKSISATNKQGPKVKIITKSISVLHKRIIKFIRSYGQKMDLSNIAIICPTRGVGKNKSLGLSVFFNLLKVNSIPFHQMYDETSCNDERKKKTKRIKGHINLITYHGTKGLEFDVVFVMDFYQTLLNRYPTPEQHENNRYLLYVATSRAISRMYICTYLNIQGGIFNHWLTKINADNYIANPYMKIANKPDPASNTSKKDDDITTGITDLISKLTDIELDMIHNYIEFVGIPDLAVKRIYRDFTSINRKDDEALFGIFCEELFYLLIHLNKKINPRSFYLIEQIIDSNFIVIDNDYECNELKKFITKNKISWTQYDRNKIIIPNSIRCLVEKYLDRTRELYSYVICNNGFVKIIEKNIKDITYTYYKYLDPKTYDYDYRIILEDYFYLIVIIYAYNNNHYFYICNHGKDKQHLLTAGKELFEEINKYVQCNYLLRNINMKVDVMYKNLTIFGEIDFIEYSDSNSETIVEIKCCKEISMKYHLQLLLYNFCYYSERGDIDHLFVNKFKIINFLTGLEHYIIIKISPANMFNILTIMAEIGNLKFTGLNLVYDLETTNLIEPVNSSNIIPITNYNNQLSNYNNQLTNLKNQRIVFFQNNGKTYAKKYPEIIDIAIKDYDTGMVLIDTLVKPNGNIHPDVQILTKIKPYMLEDKPNIDMIRNVLTSKMKNIINCKMMAHNGTRFDNEIILFDKLVDEDIVEFLDTLYMIPLHLPGNIKLKNKSLGYIYRLLFGHNFKAHRAMADVDALIKIMRHLKIKF